MKKQKTTYKLVRSNPFACKPFYAKKEIPYEIKLAARLFLDELIYIGNKNRLEVKINEAIDVGNRNQFEKLSKKYLPFTWE